MSITHHILGLLSWRSLTGYDIKKMFEDSVALYWSGNNNEIYKALVQLHQAGLVSRELQPQEKYPTRKVYSITDAGRAELKQWISSPPAVPQIKHTFLMQLAWGDQLDQPALDALLEKYEEEIQMQVYLCQAQQESQSSPPTGKRDSAYLNPAQARSAREAWLWRRILENWLSYYQRELDWVQAMRQELRTAAFNPPATNPA